MSKNEPPYIPDGVNPPTLPQYQPPVIQKPGMLGKVMSKMLKPPKLKMRTKMAHPRKLKKKQPHFY